MSYKVVTYFTADGNKTALVGPEGRKLVPVLMMENGLVVRKVPLSEQRYMREVAQHGKTKSLKAIIKQFRSFGRNTGMTKAAKSFLSDANKAA